MHGPFASKVVYSATLRPHRSAGRRGLTGLCLFVAFAWGIVGMVFFLLGAWPVLPFFGIEVVLLVLALMLNLRAGRAFEAINLTPSALTVRRVDHWGKESGFSFPPHWLQVNVTELAGGDNALELRSHGRSLTIGHCIPPAERVELAFALRRALRQLTQSSANYPCPTMDG